MDVFEILGNKFNLCNQVNDLNAMVFTETPLYLDNTLYVYTFAEVFEEKLLRTWEFSNGYIHLKDLLWDLHLYDVNKNRPIVLRNEQDALLCLQFVVNMIGYAYKKHLKTFIGFNWDHTKFFEEVGQKIRHIVGKSAFKIVQHPEKQYFVIVSGDKQLNSATENIDKDSAFLLNEYSSPLLKNNYKRKREIIKLLSNKIEPIVKTYSTKYTSGLAHDIFNDLGTLLNNFEIRHSNMDPKNEKNFKAELHSYTAKDWEEIYDTTYQLILDALLIDNYKCIHEPIIEKHKQRIGLI